MVLRDSAKSTGYGFYYSLVLLILVILLAPKIVPYGYADIVKGAQNLGPFQYSDAEQAQIDAGEKLFPHIFGTDELGRDYFIRVVYGARVSLGVGVFASLLVLIIGIIYGSVSGFCGGKVDMVMMRIVDIIIHCRICCSSFTRSCIK